MVFRRDGFLFKLAYNWNADWRTAGDKFQPSKIGILKFFGLIVWALIAWLFIIVSRILGWVVRIVGCLPALILFGYRPLGSGWRFFESGILLPFAPISRWPKLGERHVMPILVAGSIYFLFFVGYGLSKSLILLVGYVYVTTTGLWPLSVVLFFLTFFVIYYFGIRNTERWQIFKSHVKAQKSRIPTVEFK